MRAWFKQVAKGKFRIAPTGVAMFGIISGLSVFNSFYASLQSLFYGRKIRETKIETPPIFIIGHWRSGTTLLQEYMILDHQFTFADTFSCFAPQHFLLTRRWFTPLVSFLMPKKRPMDNMAVGLDRPQEDEFALCAMGMHSPYVNFIFPNNPPIDAEFLTLKSVSEHDRREWLDGLEYFLRSLTVAENKCVIFKSPPHTARIAAILERFPDAKFIHIHRNPYSLYASTFNLWMQLASVHSLQRRPADQTIEERVFSMFEEMYGAFRDDLLLLKPNQFTEVAYDDLTSQPVATLEKIYNSLNLSGFDQSRDQFTDFAASQKTYKKNQFRLAENLEKKIAERWKWYIERYGY